MGSQILEGLQSIGLQVLLPLSSIAWGTNVANNLVNCLFRPSLLAKIYMAIMKAIIIFVIRLNTEFIILIKPPAQVVDRLTSFFKILDASKLLACSLA